MGTKSINRKNIILTCALIALLCVGAIFSYFVWTEEAVNVFTVGNLRLDLTEPHWVPEDAENIPPGTELPKDPTISNIGNNAAYVFAKVNVPTADVKVIENGQPVDEEDYELFSYTVNSGWTLLGSTTADNGGVDYYYVYGTNSACTSLPVGQATPALFSTIKFADIVEGQNLGDGGTLNVTVDGYGIQTTGLSSTGPKQILAELMQGLDETLPVNILID